MSHPSGKIWQSGNYWCVCDLCGLDYRVENMMTTWDGKNVCRWDFEPRHPQDIIRTIIDDVTPKGIVTSEPEDNFVDITFVESTDNIIPPSTFELGL